MYTIREVQRFTTYHFYILQEGIVPNSNDSNTKGITLSVDKATEDAFKQASELTGLSRNRLMELSLVKASETVTDNIIELVQLNLTLLKAANGKPAATKPTPAPTKPEPADKK